MKKKLICMMVALTLMLCMMPLGAESVFASSVSFTGSTCTSNASAAANINKLIKKYPNHSRYRGCGQCWGYAEKVSTKLADSRKTRYYKSRKFSKSNFKKLCVGVKAGTHLRLSRNSTFSAYRGHSVALLKVTSKRVIWTDNNYIGTNIISYHNTSLNGFMSYYSTYGYINMVRQTTSYE
jgi:hypothetical protein